MKLIVFNINSQAVSENADKSVVSMTTLALSVPSCPMLLAIV